MYCLNNSRSAPRGIFRLVENLLYVLVIYVVTAKSDVIFPPNFCERCFLNSRPFSIFNKYEGLISYFSFLTDVYDQRSYSWFRCTAPAKHFPNT